MINIKCFNINYVFIFGFMCILMIFWKSYIDIYNEILLQIRNLISLQEIK